MSLSKNEIIDSGLLELYAIGALGDEDRLVVEQALKDYPELRNELREIENALYKYAQLNQLTAPASVRQAVMDSVQAQSGSDATDSVKNMGRRINWGMWIAAALFLGIIFQYWNSDRKWNELSEDRQAIAERCDSTQSALRERLNQLELLLSENNRIIPVDPTEKYPGTKLYFHLNDSDQRNFIQVQNLPALADNQSFQLWSLKSDQDPIPLDVFRAGDSVIIPVQFVEASNAYAITIEPEGGSQVPNLEELIGVFSI